MSRINAAAPLQPLRRVQAWLAGWWQLLLVGAALAVLALSARGRQQALQGAPYAKLYNAVVPMLAGYTVATALASLVIIRIVIVTAQSYGLSQYALGMVVRVLVLELIPLAAALAAAVQAVLPMAESLRRQRKAGAFEALQRRGLDPLATLVLPRLLAGVFVVLLLAMLSSVLTLVLAYLSAHGFSMGGFAGYTRTVGRVFSPSVTLIFSAKVLLLAVAVAWIPLATVLQHPLNRRTRASAEMQGLVRLMVVVVAIEALGLVGNYY